jgi:DNA-binding beta-propeller fold protein YncE
LSDNVSVVDLDLMTVLATVPVGRDPVAIDGPRHLTWSKQYAAFFTVLSYPHEVVSPHVTEFGGSIRAGYVQMLDARDLRPLGDVRADVRAGALALAPDGSTIAVTHYDTLRSLEGETLEERRANLVLIDDPGSIEGSGANTRRTPVCVAAAAVAYGKDASRAFVICTGEDALGVVDTEHGGLVSLVPAGPDPLNKPWTITRAGDGKRLLVSNQQADTVVVFSTAELPEVLATTKLAGVPFHTTWLNQGEYLVACQRPNAIAHVSADSGELLHERSFSVEECENPSQPMQGPDGQLTLVCSGDQYSTGALVELDPETLAITRRLELGVGPERMEIVAP